ncbi:MAG TPA: primosomal protein N' [Candidatus Saccharimonadales bacterium]|nr:primosomal protein N' [Candidatus Saccharimonadales bacterium]
MPLIRAAVLAPAAGLFTYRLPDELAPAARPGSRLRLPFGRAAREGFLVDFEGREKPGLKPVAEVLPEDLSIPPELLELTRWAAEYYPAPWGAVLMAAVPAGLAARTRRARAAAGAEEAGEAPAEGAGPRGDVAAHPAAPAAPLTPTAEQAVAIAAVEAALGAGGFHAQLLEGVTGSGKTEVYLRAAAAAVRSGGQVLVLVPEIALSPQLHQRFAARFPGRVSVLHSRLTARERRLAWLAARRGESDVVLGVRAAAFAPLPRLRLVVVDEEHEASYKQLEGLRYHARDVVVKRAQLAGAVALLGSATPSLESRANALRGRYAQLRLTRRVDGRPLPAVQVVDLRDPAQRQRSQVLSDPLLDAMGERLARGEQIILFLNRRGFAATVLCRACGEVARCTRCDVSLTLHREPAELRCHYCDRRSPPWEACPRCGSLDLKPAGAGTQRVETELARLFPGVPLVRMDLDTTRGRTAHRDLLAVFAERRASILLGTQMVAKGHDFPGVTLVGVVTADVQLYLPDFRAAERTFQLLTQVAGRAGRGAQPGTVIVQTHFPEHPAVTAAARHDAAGFAERELEERRAFHYPPAVRLVSLRLSGPDEGAVRAAAAELAARAASHPEAGQVERLGPAPAGLPRLRNRFRYQMLLRAAELRPLRALTRDLAAAAPPRGRAVRLEVDVDPIETL